MENDLHSIAFPMISAGIFSGKLANPIAVSAIECKKAYEYFIKNHPDYDVDVFLCAYSAHEYHAAQESFNNTVS